MEQAEAGKIMQEKRKCNICQESVFDSSAFCEKCNREIEKIRYSNDVQLFNLNKKNYEKLQKQKKRFQKISSWLKFTSKKNHKN